MSMDLVALVRRMPLPTGDEDTREAKFLLMLIASHSAEASSGACVASYKRLAVEFGKSRRTNERRIAALKEARWISIQRRGPRTNAIHIDAKTIRRGKAVPS